MDLKQLRYFMAIVEERQITAAARRLHMAQPPLSNQMKMLEDEIGRDAVLEYVKEVTTEILEFTEDPDVLSSAREAIAYRLMDELEK